MDLIQFEDGTKVSNAKVTINGVDYPVTPARYTGNTPLSAYILNLMQNNIAKVVVPTGGTTGQVLVKKSDNDNDVEWQTGGSGGASGDTLPIGAITEYAGATAPTNWLICDGSAISRSTYADLFNVIGTTYGQGDGLTTFNLPDYTGRVPVGKDTNDTDFDTLGKTGGEKTHTLTIQEMPSHSHTLNTGATAMVSGGSNDMAQTGGTRTYDYLRMGTTGGSQPHNILQPYITQNYIIKAFQSSGVVANVAQADTDSDTDVYSCNYINDKIGGVVVYNNSEGANTPIPFTFPTQGDSLANYSRIKIYSKVVMTGYTAYFITECEAVVGGSVSVEQTRMNSSILWLSDSARYKMNASSLTKEEEADVRILSDGSSAFNSNTTRTKIYKVELYK